MILIKIKAIFFKFRILILASILAWSFACILPTISYAKSYRSKKSVIVIDAKTGKILYSRASKSKRYPASLTKIMTLFLLFEQLERGHLTLNSKIIISRYAASMPATKIGLKIGSKISVYNAILALVTKSANDIAVAIAEQISGSESKFAKLMTMRAHQLGMNASRFHNASGLFSRYQYTTAADLALLSRAIAERFPQYYSYFSKKYFKYRGKIYRNHNHLLGRIKGLNGIKTGYVDASGYNLAASVMQNNKHLIVVVLGETGSRSRNKKVTYLVKKYLPKSSRGPYKVSVLKKLRKTLEIGSRSSRNINYWILNRNKQKLYKPIHNPNLYYGPLPKFRNSIKTRTLRTTILTQNKHPKYGNRSIWVAQIGASKSKSAINSKLTKITKKLHSKLSAYTPYIEKKIRFGKIYFRARFKGFNSLKEVRKLCTYIKEKKYECVAMKNK